MIDTISLEEKKLRREKEGSILSTEVIGLYVGEKQHKTEDTFRKRKEKKRKGSSTQGAAN